MCDCQIRNQRTCALVSTANATPMCMQSSPALLDVQGVDAEALDAFQVLLKASLGAYEDPVCEMVVRSLLAGT